MRMRVCTLCSLPAVSLYASTFVRAGKAVANSRSFVGALKVKSDHLTSASSRCDSIV